MYNTIPRTGGTNQSRVRPSLPLVSPLPPHLFSTPDDAIDALKKPCSNATSPLSLSPPFFLTYTYTQGRRVSDTLPYLAYPRYPGINLETRDGCKERTSKTATRNPPSPCDQFFCFGGGGGGCMPPGPLVFSPILNNQIPWMAARSTYLRTYVESNRAFTPLLSVVAPPKLRASTPPPPL